MFEPSAQKLIDIANETITEKKDKVNSKFTITIAAAKRARQLVSEKDIRVKNGMNPLTIAVSELENKKVCIVKESE